MTEYAVTVNSVPNFPLVRSLIRDDDKFDDMPGIYEDLGGLGPIVGVNSETGVLSVTFGLVADDPVKAAAGACRIFLEALSEAGSRGTLSRIIDLVEVMTQDAVERELDEPPETYLGAAEVAAELGISRQRVAELRNRKGFPIPVAELAAGPVWKLSSLKRFMAEWDRKPGRPRKADKAKTARPAPKSRSGTRRRTRASA